MGVKQPTNLVYATKSTTYSEHDMISMALTCHHMAKKRGQRIAKIGPFGDDLWSLRFYIGRFGTEYY